MPLGIGALCIYWIVFATKGSWGQVFCKSCDSQSPSAQRAEQIAQLGIAVEGEWILAFGTIESNGRDFAGDFPEEMRRLVFSCLERLHVILPCAASQLAKSSGTGCRASQALMALRVGASQKG